MRLIIMHKLFLSAFYYYIFTGLGVTAGAHRLWSHRSYKAKTPLRILLALMNSAALQVTYELIQLFIIINKKISMGLYSLIIQEESVVICVYVIGDGLAFIKSLW